MSDNVTDKENRKARQLERIKKLLSLSKSGNPNEAATALNMAIRILRENGLTMEDVGLSEIKSVIIKKVLSSGINKTPRYENIFLSLMKKSFGVKFVLLSDGYRKTYELYGPADRVDMAAYVCEVLVRQICAARKKYLREYCDFPNIGSLRTLKRDKADNYCLGWVSGVSRLVNSFVEITPEEEKMMVEYCDSKHKNLGTVKSRGAAASWDATGYRMGVADGLNAPLNRPVNGSDVQEFALGYRG